MAQVRPLRTMWHREPHGSEGPQNVRTTKICCKFFQTVFHSSEKTRYSGSLLCHLGVTSPTTVRGHLTVKSQEGSLTHYLCHCCHLHFPIYTQSQFWTWHMALHTCSIFHVHLHTAKLLQFSWLIFSFTHSQESNVYWNPNHLYSHVHSTSHVMFTLTLKSKREQFTMAF